MIVLSIGQTTSSGSWRATAASIAGAGVDDLDGDAVAQLGQRDERALAEAVVRGRDEQDAQVVGRERGGGGICAGRVGHGRLGSSWGRPKDGFRPRAFRREGWDGGDRG